MNTSDVSVPVIGLLGGVGAGKSSVARAAAADRRALVVDADRIGHELLDAPEVRALVVDRFGSDVLAEDGSIRRPALAQLVFGSDDPGAKADLERILHPRIGREVERRIGEAVRSSEPPEFVLLDAALMLEAGWAERCDLLVFVDTPRARRVRHVVEGRGWTEAELDRREAAQMPVDEKRRRADLVLDNDGPLEAVAERFLQLVDERLACVSGPS